MWIVKCSKGFGIGTFITNFDTFTKIVIVKTTRGDFIVPVRGSIRCILSRNDQF